VFGKEVSSACTGKRLGELDYCDHLHMFIILSFPLKTLQQTHPAELLNPLSNREED
jgi:hypothetical protein